MTFKKNVAFSTATCNKMLSGLALSYIWLKVFGVHQILASLHSNNDGTCTFISFLEKVQPARSYLIPVCLFFSEDSDPSKNHGPESVNYTSKHQKYFQMCFCMTIYTFCRIISVVMKNLLKIF